MGSAEFDSGSKQLLIHSHVITYGHAASDQLTQLIREEIETMWNQPGARVPVHGQVFQVQFRITAEYQPLLLPEAIFENINPSNNYFRIESFAQGNISFVDGIGCNTGYFMLDNLYSGSTTAAHEYGHTIGLRHPVDLDLRGQGTPGIMYPRGTLVDAEFQYNPDGRSGDSNNGGTMNPRHRRVLPADIARLRLDRLNLANPVLGEFTSMWHNDHSEVEGFPSYEA